jgi:hypothetical protein
MRGRSIQAEAVNDGHPPAECVDPRTFTMLPEIGVQSKGRANPAEASPGMAFDLAENVCDSAAGGLDGLRNVRDAVAREMIPLLEKYEN